jgi:hypothetical protein
MTHAWKSDSCHQEAGVSWCLTCHEECVICDSLPRTSAGAFDTDVGAHHGLGCEKP